MYLSFREIPRSLGKNQTHLQLHLWVISGSGACVEGERWEEAKKTFLEIHHETKPM